MSIAPLKTAKTTILKPGRSELADTLGGWLSGDVQATEQGLKNQVNILSFELETYQSMFRAEQNAHDHTTEDLQNRCYALEYALNIAVTATLDYQFNGATANNLNMAANVGDIYRRLHDHAAQRMGHGDWEDSRLVPFQYVVNMASAGRDDLIDLTQDTDSDSD